MTTEISKSTGTALPTPRVDSTPVPVPTQAVEPRQRDPRVLALQRFAMSITAFNILGHLWFGFEQAPITPIVCLLVGYASALLFETVDAWTHDRAPDYAGGAKSVAVFLLPAHIGALACGMLLYANSSLWPYLFAVVVSNASKYVFRMRVKGRVRHMLNPSNTGIAVTLVLFPWVGISPPYHFTNWLHGALSWAIPVGILVAGTMLNAGLTKKIPLILAWGGGFALQALARWLVLDQALAAALLPMTGVAFILFTNYMITDPGSTPSSRRGQVVFGLTTAVLYGVLVSLGIVFGLFFALVITCLLRAGVLLVARTRGRVPA
ncbi:enediyne biosynthesis protein UnbU [Actinokineospora inagensis]|uniref:enediyne biosynthesis protein UnbU n=1 Tax=Actinokineospora inagensis TaxID=103730 RepID=UPI000403D55C|nr:enediyne biosynthesis protein UnbU [Actinokineospora inagensis]